MLSEMEEKAAYAKATNGPASAWHVCSCHKCPYAFAKVDGSGETTVSWRMLQAARTAFGTED